jgi:hypothetical protein
LVPPLNLRVVIPLLKRIQGRATWISKPVLLNIESQISLPIVTEELRELQLNNTLQSHLIQSLKL